jgi:hypothetical protein
MEDNVIGIVIAAFAWVTLVLPEEVLFNGVGSIEADRAGYVPISVLRVQSRSGSQHELSQ